MLTIQTLLRSKSWEEVQKDLASWGIKYREEVGVHTGKTYVLFDYGIGASKIAKIVKECRGLVLEKDTWEIVRFGFYRFFNYYEEACDKLNLKTPIISEEKADGSLIILSYFDGDWIAGTRGRIFTTDFVNTTTCRMPFNKLFWKIFGRENASLLDKNLCYVFELTSLHNRIVIPYSDAKLVFLAARDVNTWKELTDDEAVDICNYLKDNGCTNLRFPERYHFKSIDEAVNAVNKLDHFQEGFVLKQWDESVKGYRRVKIKGKSYLDMHHVVTALSIKNLVRMVLNESRGYLTTYPEFLADYDTIAKHFDDKFVEIEKEYKDALNAIKATDDPKAQKKEFAMQVLKSPHKGVHFALYDGKTTDIKEFYTNFANHSKAKLGNIIKEFEILDIVDDKWKVIDDPDEDI